MEGTQEGTAKPVEEIVKEILEYHRPDEAGIAKITKIRTATGTLIVEIMASCPPSADRSAAVRKAREAMMTANASIVLDGRSL